MADAVVEFVLTNLKELLLYHADLIFNVKDRVESLHKELSLMKAFLKDSREKRDESDYVREIVRHITDVTYEAEVIIDKVVVDAALQESRSTLKKIFNPFNHASVIYRNAKEIEDIKVKVKEIYDKKMFGILSLPVGELSRRRSRMKRQPNVEEHNVVGFNEEANAIIDRLIKGPDLLEVISIVEHWPKMFTLTVVLNFTSIFVHGHIYLKNTAEGKCFFPF